MREEECGKGKMTWKGEGKDRKERLEGVKEDGGGGRIEKRLDQNRLEGRERETDTEEKPQGME